MRSKETQLISLKIYTCACMLKSVLDNSGSRQEQETDVCIFRKMGCGYKKCHKIQKLPLMQSMLSYIFQLYRGTHRITVFSAIFLLLRVI